MTQDEAWKKAQELLKTKDVIAYRYADRCVIAPPPGTFNAHVVYGSGTSWEEALVGVERCANSYYYPDGGTDGKQEA